MRRRKGRPEPIGGLVQQVLQDLGEGEAVRVLRIAERWEDAVGHEVAQHCRPTALRGSLLLASVDSSVWCQQLQLRTPEILAGLARVFGEDAPTAVRLRVARGNR